MIDTRFGTNPHDIYPEDFEADVFSIVDMFSDDLGIELQVEMGDRGGLFVEVIAVRDVTGRDLIVGHDAVGLALAASDVLPRTFYSVDEFRAFVNTFAPEDY